MSISPCSTKMTVPQNGLAEVVPQGGDDQPESVYQAQFVEEMKQKGIVAPRSVAKGTATDRRKYTIKYRARLGSQVAKERSRLQSLPPPEDARRSR